MKPDGTPLRARGGGFRLDPVKEQMKLPAGRVVVSPFGFDVFYHDLLPEVGEYELHVSLRTAEGLVVAPVVKFTVIEPAPDSILVSRTVPVEGFAATRPKDQQEQAVLQQIKIRDRTWLVYRRFLSPANGGKVSHTSRITELPGKCELTVEGSPGDWGPLTITYKATPDAKPTKLVINSVNGLPWTEEEERLRQERLKREREAKKP